MRLNCRRLVRDERGFVGTLIEILVVAAIILILVYYFVGHTNREGKTMPRAVKERAQSVECMANLRNIRTAITMYRDQSEGQNPGSLGALKDLGVAPGMTQCPVGKASYPYVYDPATGSVNCRYPGHEKY